MDEIKTESIEVKVEDAPVTPQEPAPETLPEGSLTPEGESQEDQGEKHYSKRGSSRWNNMVRQSKEGERYKAENDELKSETKELKEMMKQLIQTQTAASNESKMKSLEDKYAKATEEGNYQEQAKINAEYQQLSQKQYTPQQPEQQPAQQPIQQQQQVPVDVQAAFAVFEQQNGWYGEDMGLTYAMDGLISDVSRDYNYSKTSPSTKLNESLKRLKKSFPEKFKKNSLPSSVGGVTPNEGGNNGSKILKVTREEANFAVTFYPELSPDDAIKRYAKAKTT